MSDSRFWISSPLGHARRPWHDAASFHAGLASFALTQICPWQPSQFESRRLSSGSSWALPRNSSLAPLDHGVRAHMACVLASKPEGRQHDAVSSALREVWDSPMQGADLLHCARIGSSSCSGCLGGVVACMRGEDDPTFPKSPSLKPGGLKTPKIPKPSTSRGEW